MGLLRWYLRNELKALMDKGVRIQVIGDRTLFAKDIQELIAETEEKTKNNTTITVVLALSYGSRDEIVRTFKKLAQKGSLSFWGGSSRGLKNGKKKGYGPWSNRIHWMQYGGSNVQDLVQKSLLLKPQLAVIKDSRLYKDLKEGLSDVIEEMLERTQFTRPTTLEDVLEQDRLVRRETKDAYSLAEGAIHTKNISKLCKINGMPAVGITDTSNLFGALEIAMACAEQGVQPIIGSQSEEGYLNLLKLERERAVQLLKTFQEIFKDRLYIELMRHGLADQKRLEPQFLELALEHSIPLVATNDVFFDKPDMFEAHDALLCVAEGSYVSQDVRPIKNVGAQAMETVILERKTNGPYKTLSDLAARLDPRAVNKRQLENLVAAGALDSIHKNRQQTFMAIDMILAQAQLTRQEKQNKQALLFGGGKGEDADGVYEVAFFSETYAQIRDKLIPGKAVFVSAALRADGEGYRLTGQGIKDYFGELL
eukprot:gene14802-14935_t